VSIIRPPISGDSPQDSWANQVTEAINKGLLAPSVNPSSGSSVISSGSLNAATVYLYARTTTAVAPPVLTIDVTYDYRTTSFTPSAPLGDANWQPSPPGTSIGDYLWVINVNISASTEKEVIAASSWSPPVVFSVNGLSVFALEIFQRASNAPSTPTGGSYNFGTKTITTPSGWSSTFPSGANPVYVSSTIASSTGTAGVDSNLTWSAPVKLVEDGTPATEIESGLVYYQTAATNNPGTPSATGYDFIAGNFINLSSGWGTTPVTVLVTTTTALFWSSRYRITQAPNQNATVTFSTPLPSVNFGTNIQSDNFSAGFAGWQISRASGNAEFNNVDIRGGAVASSVVVGQPGSTNIYTVEPTSTTSGVATSNATGLYLNSVHNRIEVWNGGQLRIILGGLAFAP